MIAQFYGLYMDYDGLWIFQVLRFWCAEEL